MQSNIDIEVSIILPTIIEINGTKMETFVIFIQCNLKTPQTVTSKHTYSSINKKQDFLSLKL